ncbi:MULTISPECIES: hypothetical protein [unclassified Sphingopyxis]|uniref:hypothetical protein n=1 Tax=unclassified Sphingopyxis TaxID=2614943 RepID=UPI0007378C31|nr:MULTISPECIES: hypothetical protein [unclassified Sphingopyxis]KTE34297.1 hypothetical protein ATE62_16030 [Sphingopyxis sp. HIX]KTE79936.1 hypothetical protein ATE72_18425 [Sphingopyxis sp. HXXIV]
MPAMIARLAAAAALLLTAALPASAAEPATCAAPADLSATPYAAWTGADGDSAALVAGTPVTLAMTGGAASRSVRIAEAGKYGVAADSKVWIDLMADGEPLTSVGHGHGPDCSGIRKVVWFDLAAGEYELALTKAVAEKVRLLVVKAP